MPLPKDPAELTSMVEQGLSEIDIEKIADEIRGNYYSISTFVEKLEPVLTSKDNAVRAKGTLLLSRIVDFLATDLSPEELNVLVIFFVDRLSDQHSVIPAVIRGLLVLIKCKNLPITATSKIFKKFFQMVPCQSQVREDRTFIFELLKVATELRQTELLSMGPDFVLGLITSIEGERDPRNLLFLFKLMPQFIRKFPLYGFTEEMFEVFACYFPIDFHPTPNDPDAITRELLAENLANCLCACNDFADNCIELILEKLESDLNVAKADSLCLLQKCATRFDNKSMETNFNKIWSVLKKEIYPEVDRDISDLAIASLKSIIASLSDKDAVDKVLLTIISTIVVSLTDISSPCFASAIKISVSCGEASPDACTSVTTKILPTLLSRVENATNEISEMERNKILEAIQKLLIAMKGFKLLSNPIENEEIRRAQNVFIKIVLFDDKVSTLRIALETIQAVPEIVSHDNRFALYARIIDLLRPTSALLIRENSLSAVLISLGTTYPDEVMTVVIDKAGLDLEILPNLLPLIHLNKFLKPLSEKIFGIILNDKTDDKMKEVISTKLCELLKDDAKPVTSFWLSNGFFDKTIAFYQKESSHESDLLHSISLLIAIIMKSLDPEQQITIVKTYLPNLNLKHTTDLYIAAGILAYLDERVMLEDHFEYLVTEITTLATTTNDQYIKELCNHLLCSMFNKMPEDQKHRNILSKITHFLQQEIKQHNKQAVEALAWISKALLARGFKDASDIVDTLSELLDHPNLAEVVELAFEILTMEAPQLHLPNLKYLFKQKLFVVVCKKLERKLEEYTIHHLSALAYVMQATPHQVLKMEIKKIGPIFFKCLELEAEKPLECTLKMLHRFLEDKVEFFGEQMQQLIPLLLHLTTFQAKMKIRILALNCLETLTSYPTFMLLPHKNDVLHNLVSALDDKKRFVRTAAVQTRLKWFMVGEPTEDS